MNRVTRQDVLSLHHGMLAQGYAVDANVNNFAGADPETGMAQEAPSVKMNNGRITVATADGRLRRGQRHVEMICGANMVPQAQILRHPTDAALLRRNPPPAIL